MPITHEPSLHNKGSRAFPGLTFRCGTQRDLFGWLRPGALKRNMCDVRNARPTSWASQATLSRFHLSEPAKTPTAMFVDL
jgi:hypothetical protein